MNQGWFRRNGIASGDMVDGIWLEKNEQSKNLTLDSLRRIIKEELLR
jgi:hypothetical protein